RLVTLAPQPGWHRITCLPPVRPLGRKHEIPPPSQSKEGCACALSVLRRNQKEKRGLCPRFKSLWDVSESKFILPGALQIDARHFRRAKKVCGDKANKGRRTGRPSSPHLPRPGPLMDRHGRRKSRKRTWRYRKN